MILQLKVIQEALKNIGYRCIADNHKIRIYIDIIWVASIYYTGEVKLTRENKKLRAEIENVIRTLMGP